MLVVDEPSLFAESLCTALALDGYDVHFVLPEAPTAGSFDDRAAGRPRVAVVDLDVEAAYDVLQIIRSLDAHGARVVVVTASDDRDRWAECLDLGASTVVSKNVTLHELVSVVHRVVAGQPVITDEERDAMLATWHAHERTEHELSERFALLDDDERRVLGHLMSGRFAADIARRAAVPQHYVNAQIGSILSKLRVSSPLAAVALANDVDWSPPA